MERVDFVNVNTVVENSLYLPFYAHILDAGADLKANIEEPVVMAPGESAFFDTGVKIELPDNVAGLIRSRSGLARKHSVIVLGDGTIDPPYRGSLGVTLINLGRKAYAVQPGDRIAQLVLVPIVRAKFNIVEQLSSTDRGEGGFGHTGR